MLCSVEAAMQKFSLMMENAFSAVAKAIVDSVPCTSLNYGFVNKVVSSCGGKAFSFFLL